MPVIGPSNLIGAQAYASQVRRQSAQDTDTRAAAQQRDTTEQASRQQSVRDAAVRIDTRTIDTRDIEAKRTARQLELAEFSAAQPEQGLSRLARAGATTNPTLGEVERRANPEAQPRPAPVNREAPNGAARSRFVPPGTQIDIRV